MPLITREFSLFEIAGIPLHVARGFRCQYNSMSQTSEHGTSVIWVVLRLFPSYFPC
jgi:hypothetical protein